MYRAVCFNERIKKIFRILCLGCLAPYLHAVFLPPPPMAQHNSFDLYQHEGKRKEVQYPAGRQRIHSKVPDAKHVSASGGPEDSSYRQGWRSSYSPIYFAGENFGSDFFFPPTLSLCGCTHRQSHIVRRQDWPRHTYSKNAVGKQDSI